MKKKHLLFFLIMVIAGVLTIWSCKKDKDEEKVVTKQEAVAIAKGDAVSDAAYDDIYAESEEVVAKLENTQYPATSSLKSGATTGSRTITVTKNAGNVSAFPKEITVTYTNYVALNGVKKNGTIKITQNAKMREAGAVRTVTLENFTIKDTIHIEGVKTITNMGLVDAKPTVKIELANGKITLGSGNYYTLSFTHNISWEEGFLTPFNIFDDVYSVASTSQGSSKEGLSYTTNTVIPLEYKVGAFCIKKGKIDIKVEDKITVTLDFTRETCLEKVKLTVEGETQTFNIW